MMTTRITGNSLPAFLTAILLLAFVAGACSSGREAKSTAEERPLRFGSVETTDSSKQAERAPEPLAPKIPSTSTEKNQSSDPAGRAATESERKAKNDSWRELYEQEAESWDADLPGSEEDASAVDDDVWRQFNLADEYHSMGVLANREGSWEEAQYYFEKCLGILAGLDIETDSTLTPEALKYTSLLEDVVADYRITLRSLGRLEENAQPSVLLERFTDLEPRLSNDSIRVFRKEGGPASYDLPVVMNDRVKRSIVYFQTVAREAFVKFLTRSRRYEPLYREVLAQYNMPQDLLYLSMIESGFNPHAYSWARAMGLWQFIASTGKMYGLKRNWWLDERKDPVKATHAAARFLGDLYRQFGDWELAMAAYNGGPGRVSRTIAKQKTDDFWKLKLRQQTMDYVPLIFAACIISKDPEKYGFTDIVYEEPIRWEEVSVNKSMSLASIAKAIGCSEEELRTLNPELLRHTTPPNFRDYKLKIPVGYGSVFAAAYDDIGPSMASNMVTHKVKRGESIGSISSRYGVSKYAILEANSMTTKSKLIAGKELLVPIPADREYVESEPAKKTTTRSASNSIYRVRSGDTMWDIAKAFGTTVDAIRQINTLPRGSRLYVGQKLRIPGSGKKVTGDDEPTYASAEEQSGKSSGDGASTYTVRSGDTVWDIARKYNMTTGELRRLNNLGSRATIKPGQRLIIAPREASEYVVHQVRRGETVSRIAQSYRTSIASILSANGLRDPNSIQVGDELKIYVK